MERDEDPQEVEAAVLLPHEVFGALHSMGQSKAGCMAKQILMIMYSDNGKISNGNLFEPV